MPRARNELIQLIRDRCSGRSFDVARYVQEMDEIMTKVHAFYSAEPYPTGFLQVDIETFMNYCWEKLEAERLVFKLSDISFENDIHLRRYVRKTFENLLREKAKDLSPGFRARQKQVERVLKRICLSTCKDFCGCWKLEEYRHETCTPTEATRLMKVAASLPTPELKPTKNPDLRGPSLKDEQMRGYLVSLLRAVGGMARHRDLLSVISRQFGLFTIRIETTTQDGSEAEFTLTEDVFLSPDHEIMARELVEGMSPDMVDIHYFRIVKGLTIEQTAKKMGKSAGTVHNREKAYREYITRYFWGARGTFEREEMEAVMQLVSLHIAESKEAP